MIMHKLMSSCVVKSFAGFFLGLFVLGFCAASAAQEEQGKSSASNFTRGQILETWGWIIAHKENVAGIEISETESTAFLKGFSEGLENRPLSTDADKIFPDVEKLAKARREKIVRAITQKNEAEANVFFAELKKDTNVAELPGGVFYKVFKSGNGAFPKPQQTVTVDYIARLIGGTEFGQMDSIDLVLVTNRNVCRDWFEAVQKIGKGGVLKLFIPPPLSEDDAFKWGISPGSAMIFEIKLTDVKDTSTQDLENALVPPAPEPLEPPPSGYDNLQIIEAWGWKAARESHASKFELGDYEMAEFTKGLAAGVEGEPSPFDLEKISPAIQQFVADRREKVLLATKQKRLAEMETLFAGLKQNTNVVELPDGLRYEILKPGTGVFPKSGQIVLVDYAGRLFNGTIFDKTYNEPLHIEVGSVIDGWSEGIQKIGKGGKIKLYIPPTLGYGDEDRSGVVAPIPANSVLIYEIELLDVQDK
jgi:FKBP-type peptidyl-prolyl cis-trans isomerase